MNEQITEAGERLLTLIKERILEIDDELAKQNPLREERKQLQRTLDQLMKFGETRTGCLRHTYGGDGTCVRCGHPRPGSQ